MRNLSYQRLQLKGPNRFGASLHSRGHIWEHLQRCAARRQNLEVAIVIGVHPAINLAAGAKVAMEVDEFDVAGALLGRPVDLVKCKTIDVEVPAEAEFVLEGEILADVHEDEGPYGEYTGYSTDRSTTQRVRREGDHIAPQPDLPRHHSGIFGRASAAGTLRQGGACPHAPEGDGAEPQGAELPEIRHPLPCLHVDEEDRGRPAAHALMLLLGLDPYLKFVVAVDEDVNVFDEEEVLWAMATRFQADTDMFMVPDVFCNRLDPSSRDGMSAKLALDATAPLKWDVERAVVAEDAAAWAAKVLARI